VALALRPAVLLIVVASLLFLLAGALDSLSACVQGGAGCGQIGYSALESYVLGIVNLFVAVLIARGSERILAIRIGLAAFFVVERPVSAVAFGVKPADVLVVHLITAAIEAVILVSTLRIWKLGHSVSTSDLDMLALDAAPYGAAEAPAVPAVQRRPVPAEARGRTVGSASATVGRLAILLALVLAADTVVAFATTSGALDLASPRSLGAVLALVLLATSLPAVHGRPLALRLLLILSLLTFVERAFSPFALGLTDMPTLLLHAAGALVALVLAVASVSAVRSSQRGQSA
jgi:hypothetical protein